MNRSSITKIVETEEGEYEMMYLLLESSEEDDEDYKTYSYRVEQYAKAQDREEKKLVEYSESSAVFDDYDQAVIFLKLISDGLVFPETLLYHIDDWFSAFHISDGTGC